MPRHSFDQFCSEMSKSFFLERSYHRKHCFQCFQVILYCFTLVLFFSLLKKLSASMRTVSRNMPRVRAFGSLILYNKFFFNVSSKFLLLKNTIILDFRDFFSKINLLLTLNKNLFYKTKDPNALRYACSERPFSAMRTAF